MSEDDILYYNPANYVVDVIGAGLPLPGRGGTGYRRLTAAEQTLLDNCPECAGAINHATWQNSSPLDAYGQHTSQMQFVQFSCMGLQFIRVANPAIPGPAITSVWNHPGPLQVTGLKGTPTMSTTPHLEPGVGAYHPNPWRQLTAEEENVLGHAMICASCPCGPAFQKATKTLVNGMTQSIFTCGNYTFLHQNSVTPSSPSSPGRVVNYWYVYNHPGQVVFNMKQYERPAVPSRALHGVPHWPSLGHPDEGLAQTAALPNPQNRAEINAAIDLLAYFDTNGCSRSSLPVVTEFQIAYNASGLPGQLTKDGEYGPNSQRALQNVMDEAQADAGAGPSQQAPANCFPEYGQVPSIPALDVTPAATPSATPSGTYTAPVTTVTSGAPKSNAAVLLIGGAAAATAGGLGYWYWKKHKHGR